MRHPTGWPEGSSGDAPFLWWDGNRWTQERTGPRQPEAGRRFPRAMDRLRETSVDLFRATHRERLDETRVDRRREPRREQFEETSVDHSDGRDADDRQD